MEINQKLSILKQMDVDVYKLRQNDQDIPGASPDQPTQDSLEDLAGKIEKCELCGLHQSRTHTVFGSGNPNAKVMFVGEAPGADEDAQGQPFVGRAGQLLTLMLQPSAGRGPMFILLIYSSVDRQIIVTRNSTKLTNVSLI